MDVRTRPELHDDVLDDEIRLLADVILAAGRATGHLTPPEVDRLLDVPDHAPPPSVAGR